MDPFIAISQTALFGALSENSRRQLAAVSFCRNVAKRDVLFVEGDSGHSIYVLHQGIIQLHKTAPNGSETVIKIIQPGEIFAEVVLFEQASYPATAVALSSSVIFMFPKKHVHRLLDIPNFRNDFISVLLQKQRYLAERIYYLSSLDVEGRFLEFLRQHGASPAAPVTIDMSKKDIASAIGTTPETLSRLILKLERRGVLSWEGKRIQLSQRDAQE